MTAIPLPAAQNRAASSGLRPTTVRWRFMALLSLVNMLPSLGKIGLGVTAKYIQDDSSLAQPPWGGF